MLYPVTGCNGEGVAALPTDLFTVDAARAASRHDRVNAVRTAAISPIGITGFKPLSPKSDRRHGVRRKCDSRTVQPLRMGRSEEHTSELQSLMRILYAVFCLQNKKNIIKETLINRNNIHLT